MSQKVIYRIYSSEWMSEWVKVILSCPTLCDLMDYTVCGILQARILEWAAFPSSGHLPNEGSNPHFLWFLHCRQILYHWATGEAPVTIDTVRSLIDQLCLTLCDPMDYTIHWILQARILEWVAFPFSRGSSQHRDQTQVSCIAGRFFSIWAPRVSPPKGPNSKTITLDTRISTCKL